MIARFLFAMLLLIGLSANADEPHNEARTLFHEGAAAYDAGDFQPALEKFQVAAKLAPLPELDYNIARCLDRLERWPEAVVFYERYLDARPTDPIAPSIRERIQLLRARSAGEASIKSDVMAPPMAAPRASRGSWTPAIAVAGTALGAAVIGTGLLARTRVEYDGCIRPCSDARIDHLRGLAIGGYVMFGVAGVAAVVDLALIATQARRRR
ncbi:MAG: tetratricopeptide repeat protein [Polyangia bacterium]